MDYWEYKGYKGSVEYSKEDDHLYGKVSGMGNKALILYEGSTIKKKSEAHLTLASDYQYERQAGLEPVTLSLGS